jgi:hypothetical protein
MPLPVSLQAVVDELDTVSDETSAYIHRETGELYTLTSEDMHYAEGDDDEEDVPDWQQESRAKAKEILGGDAWLSLPSKFDINEWEIMRDFAQSQADDRLAERLLRAIQGKGAFRYFKDVLIEEGIRDAWFDFRQRAFEQIAEEFLTQAKIPFTKEPQ